MADQIYKELGENIRKLRLDRGWSQEEFAHKIGRDTRSVVAIETGKRNPTLRTIHNICKSLNVGSNKIIPFQKIIPLSLFQNFSLA